MKILAHRGCWDNNTPPNSLQALRTALERGYGIESDVRDYCGKLVISHDMAGAESPEADKLFHILAEYRNGRCFAVNIKADGIKRLLRAELLKNDIADYFAFDMSVPQMVEYARDGLRFFTRCSEVEAEPVMLEQASGVWVDSFFSEDWIDEGLLRSFTEAGKEVCVVSPELHGRPHEMFWRRLAELPLDFGRLLLCTDHPDEAAFFFKGGRRSEREHRKNQSGHF